MGQKLSTPSSLPKVQGDTPVPRTPNALYTKVSESDSKITTRKKNTPETPTEGKGKSGRRKRRNRSYSNRKDGKGNQ